MLRIPVALILLCVATPSFAQAVFRWVDKEGTTHYTDNPASIPQGATVFATEGEPISEMGKPAPVVLAAPKPLVAIAEQQPSDTNGPSNSEQYWRSQFRAAREKIRELEVEIAVDRHRTEDANGLPAGVTYSCGPYLAYAPPVAYGGSVTIGPKGVQGSVGPLPQPGYYSPFNTCIQAINPEYERSQRRLEKNRSGLERAREDLHELERRASFDAVPLEWRR